MRRILPFALIAIVLIAAVAGAYLFMRSRQQSDNQNNSTPETLALAPGAAPPHVRGNANAPVTVEEFGDFQCPTCGTYYGEMKKIEADYGDRLKVIFRQLPLGMHEHALMAAQAAEAAGMQGKFWEMHDKLYENQTTWTTAKDLLPVFVDYAKQIGLNPDQFVKDLNSDAVADRIFQDGKRAHTLGFQSTPSFLVNGKVPKGDQWRPEGVRQMINEALKEAGQQPPSK